MKHGLGRGYQLWQGEKAGIDPEVGQADDGIAGVKISKRRTPNTEHRMLKAESQIEIGRWMLPPARRER
jgi:hypothetical protein